MPKLLIDIRDEIYEDIKERVLETDIFDEAECAIKNGMPLDDCSNREVLEKLFDANVLFQWDLEDTRGTLVHIGGRDVALDRDWCKRKWGK